MSDLNPVDILLVEDNPADAELMIRALKKHNLANHLAVVEDGEQALDFLFGRGEYINRSPCSGPRVVFLDLKLPKINGLEVLKAMRENDCTRTTPVVIVTSSKEDPDIKSAYELGANSYVVKPVNFDQFMESVKQLGFYWLLVNQPPK